MPTQTFTLSYVRDATGTLVPKLVTTTSEGIQVTTVSGNVVSSKTPSQVSIESSFASQGVQVTPKIEDEIALGLQQQTKQALKGETPKSFTVDTGRGQATVSTNLTPNMLAGATGSMIPKGFILNETGQLQPANQRFTTSQGIEFQATSTGQKGDRPGEYLYSTPFGEISSRPDQLQKNIQRQREATAHYDQYRLEMYRRDVQRERIEQEKNKQINRVYYSVSHMLDAPSALLGGIGFALTGRKGSDPLHNLKEGLSEVGKNYDKWVTYQVQGGSKIPLAIQDSIFLAGSVATVGVASSLSTAGSVATWSLKQSVLTGVAQGLGYGFTAIGTAEAIKGIKEGSAIRAGQGVIMASGGALTAKASWSGVQQALKKDFLSLNEPKVTAVGNAQALQQYDPNTKEFVGRKESNFIAQADGKTYRGKSITDFNAKIENQMTKGFGSINTKITDNMDDIVIKKDIFLTKGGQLGNDKTTIFSRTIYGPSEGSNINIITDKAGRTLNQAGFHLAFNELKNTNALKQMTSLTKIETSFQGFPRTTIDISAGKNVMSGFRTDISTLIDKFDDVLISGSGSTGSGLSSKINSLSGTATGLESQIFKQTIKDITINTPKIVGVSPVFLNPKINTGSSQKQTTQSSFADLSVQKLNNININIKVPDFNVNMGNKNLQTPFTNFGFGSGTSSLTGIGTSTSFKLDQIQMPKIDTISMGNISPINPTIDPVIPDIRIPTGFGLPDFSFGWQSVTRRRRSSKKTRPKTSYKPSFEALDRMLRGKRPKIITGLGLRPIVTKRKKRRKRK